MMNALANSLVRIWSANNRVPRLTGRGNPGCGVGALRVWMRDSSARRTVSEIVAFVERTAPTVLLLAFNIFR